ncbi:MAG TPA: ATP-binding cassette domain-containing protein, partial [Candidatus Dormibacteraeota bacterium]|nr:ATP-binding cassette domain-containing protein [Candidatus Dormibacteraeota bacterium]
MKAAPGPLLRVEGLTVNYPAGRAGWLGRERLLVQAVDDVSFTIAPGETLGLVGETGSGKTTTGRAVLRRVPLAAGRIWFDGRDITEIGGHELRRLRARMQLVFQDPYASLNPRMTVGDIVAEPLVVHRAVQGRQELRERVRELLHLVGLPPDAASRYPMAFSGGQRQRIGIARALAL